ncbi:MAG: DUF4080 domain-containing protein [Desulfobulbales bacterium]
MFFKLIAFNGRFIHSCLALFYVRDALVQKLSGCEIEMVQYTINDPYYPTLRQLGSGKPDGLFFSVYIWNSFYIQRLIKDMVKLLPDTPIILGGPQAVAMTRSLPPEILDQCTVIPGEIEGVERTFYQDLGQGRLQQQYSCVKESGFRSPYRCEDFKSLLANRNIYYESSRGCPFGCTYCLSSLEKGVRHLPLSQVYEEISDILQSSPKVIRFVDRTFNDLPARALDIWRFLAEQPGETLFHFEMAPDRFTEEMFLFLEQMKPGRFQFELGMQSTNQQTLEAINRKCNLKRAEKNIRRLVALDTIHIHLDLILGLPFEDYVSFIHSFGDVFRLGPHYIQMGLLKVLPETLISRAIDEYDMIVCDCPPYEILSNRWLSAPELEELFWFGECVEAFYNNRYFRSIWKYLNRTKEDVYAFFKSLLLLCRERNFFSQAHTQEQLSALLWESIRHRPDGDLLRELLVFDWLRCGHRYLPTHLKQGPTIVDLKKTLWHKMDLRWDGVFDYKSRDEFFKQGIFYRFSGQFLQEVGLSLSNEDDTGYICFLLEREETVFKLSRFMLMPSLLSNPES